MKGKNHQLTIQTKGAYLKNIYEFISYLTDNKNISYEANSPNKHPGKTSLLIQRTK
jgi:hypothetical protein